MKDNEYRKFIIENLDSNIFVLAGAGSGKTTILVDRMVSLVEEKEDIISKISAITFTKNAATHFLSKFAKRLKERSEMTKEAWEMDKTTYLKEPTELSKKRCKDALNNINQCFAGTIDAFCNLIISEHPLEANVPSSSKIIDEEEFPILYKKEYSLISKRKEPYQDLWDKYLTFSKLNQNPANVFSNSIIDIMEASILDIEFEAPKISLEDRFKAYKNDYEKLLKQDIKYILDHEDDIEKKDGITEKFKKFKDLYWNFDRPWTIKTILDIKYLKNNIKDFRFIHNPDFKVLPFKLMPRAKVYAFDEKMDSDYQKLVSGYKSMIYDYSIDFLIDASKAIRKKLKSEGKLSFTDYLLYFKEMLLKDMDNPNMPLIKHIRNRHSIFLLDESQDTSPIQTEIFMLLSSNVPAKSKHECRPIPGSLFIVGDPKQSIYRFKGADIDAYNDTKEMFSLDNKENSLAILSNNFRSTNTLCEYFNDVFMNLPFFYPIPKKDSYKSSLENITTGIYSYTNYIDVIKELVSDNSKYKKIIKKDGKEIEVKFEYKDIMLITKNTTPHQEIIKELKNAGLPVFVEGRFSLLENEALEAIYAIYAYIVKDSIEYKYNLLASPLFKMVGSDLKGIVEDDLLKEINELKMNRFSYSPYSLYTIIIEKLKLFLYVSKENMEYVYFLGEKLKEAFMNGNISDFSSAEAFISNFIFKSLDRCPSLVSEPNAIHLANLHKVKGLEAKVVILIPAKDRAKTISLHQDFNLGKSYIIRLGEERLKNGATIYSIETDSFKEKEEKEKELLKEEELRLKYVAATRAMNFLFIPKELGYWKELGSHELFIASSNTIEKEKVNAIFKAENIEFNRKASYQIKRPSDDHLELEILEEARVESKSILKATEKGNLIHKMMELYILSNFKYEKKDLIMATMAKEGFGGKEIYDILDDVYETLVNKGGYMQYKNKYPSDILSILKSADELHPEFPFYYEEDNNIIYGLIDLLYIKDNKVYIIDYKTNYEPESYLGIIDWEEKYAGQLEAYSKAIKKIYNMEVEAHIYHIG